MARSDYKFHVRKRVRYAEIDAQRVVFNSRYLEYFDIGITEYWRGERYDLARPRPGPNSMLRAEIDYRRPFCSTRKSTSACARRGSGAVRWSFISNCTARAWTICARRAFSVSVHVAEAQGAPSPGPR